MLLLRREDRLVFDLRLPLDLAETLLLSLPVGDTEVFFCHRAYSEAEEDWLLRRKFLQHSHSCLAIVAGITDFVVTLILLFALIPSGLPLAQSLHYR